MFDENGATPASGRIVRRPWEVTSRYLGRTRIAIHRSRRRAGPTSPSPRKTGCMGLFPHNRAYMGRGKARRRARTRHTRSPHPRALRPRKHLRSRTGPRNRAHRTGRSRSPPDRTSHRVNHRCMHMESYPSTHKRLFHNPGNAHRDTTRAASKPRCHRQSPRRQRVGDPRV